jgi:hypothetical protein
MKAGGLLDDEAEEVAGAAADTAANNDTSAWCVGAAASGLIPAFPVASGVAAVLLTAGLSACAPPPPPTSPTVLPQPPGDAGMSMAPREGDAAGEVEGSCGCVP